MENISGREIQDAFTDTTTKPSDSAEQTILLELRNKIAELEAKCEKLDEEKNILECRIEQRNLQVDSIAGRFIHR